MASNLNLEIRINAHTSGLTTALNQSTAEVSRFERSTVNAFGRMKQSAGALYNQLNGFSGLTKLAAMAGGMALVNDLVQRNLDFERGLLDMKQTAQMTAAQALEMRKLAIDAASPNMALPSEIMAGIKAFTAAGMKFDQVKASINEAARAAVAFRVPVEAIAKMDFDLQDKLGLDPKQIQASHNMLLYHAKSGRFEPKAMAEEAPKYLNSAKTVGIMGLKGLNLVGAMTQQLMKLAPATQPAEVSTFMEHFFGHLTSPQYVKGLAKKGINIKKFMPKGKFYGEGGVDGLMDFLAELKKKGLDDPFKLSEAGFREQYTKKAAKQLMDSPDLIKAAMKNGDDASKEDMVGQDKSEIMNSNYGKIAQSEITKEKKMVGDTANGIVGAWADLNKWAAENPLSAILASGGAFFGGRVLGKKMGFFGGNGGAGSALGNVTSALGVQKVFVTNFPPSMGGKPTFRTAVESAASGAGAVGVATKGAGALTLLGTGAGIAAPVIATGVAIGYGFEKFAETKTGITGQQHKVDGQLDQAIKRLNLEKQMGGKNTWEVSKLESQIKNLETERGKLDAQLKALEETAKRPIQVMLPDGRVLAETVNAFNDKDARRR